MVQSQAAATTAGIRQYLAADRRRRESGPGQTHASYGALRTPIETGPGLLELRRQQALFGDVTREIGWQNAWLPAAGIAPVAAVLALEAGPAVLAGLGIAAGRKGVQEIARRAPHEFQKIGRIKPGGETWETRAGRAAHKELETTVDAKPGWKYEPAHPKTRSRVDVGAPARGPDPYVRRQMELKPDTPSGRKAAARAVKRYERETGNKTRAIYYDPKKYR